MAFQPVKNIDYDWITAVYKNGDHTDLSFNNLEWDFEGYKPPISPFDSKNKDVFVSIPGFSNYEITPSGVVRNKTTHEILTPGLSSVGYMCCRITDDSGKSTYVGIHHLMARALLEHPTDVDQLVVNHLDGVKTSNLITNIEWASYSKNILHAHYNGLRVEIIPVYAKTVKLVLLDNFLV